MRIAEAQLVRAIYELAEAKTLSEKELSLAVKSFLARKRLAKRTGKVLRALEAEREERNNLVMVHATMAHALSREAEESIQAKAEELFGKEGRKTITTFHESPKLLGGVRLETQNTRYDFSLTRTLVELHKSFAK